MARHDASRGVSLRGLLVLPILPALAVCFMAYAILLLLATIGEQMLDDLAAWWGR